MNETKESATIQKIGEDLIISIPTNICETLNIKEGSEVILEVFLCNGETGIRIKPKT
jgi:antitoxin component of MazEF toxin-antitoxin module